MKQLSENISKRLWFRLLFPVLALITMNLFVKNSKAEEPKTAPVNQSAPGAPADQPAAAPAGEDNGEYEIDYEEEPEVASDDEVEKPSPKKKERLPKASKVIVSTAQGTRSKNKFAPILKSDTKSIYRKNGKPLDVDTE